MVSIFMVFRVLSNLELKVTDPMLILEFKLEAKIPKKLISNLEDVKLCTKYLFCKYFAEFIWQIAKIGQISTQQRLPTVQLFYLACYLIHIVFFRLCPPSLYLNQGRVRRKILRDQRRKTKKKRKM